MHGVVGLGTGTVAAHGRAGDTLRFYEINPEVERIANEYFYFLREAQAATEVVLGDGRISLERELRHSRGLSSSTSWYSMPSAVMPFRFTC